MRPDPIVTLAAAASRAEYKFALRLNPGPRPVTPIFALVNIYHLPQDGLALGGLLTYMSIRGEWIARVNEGRLFKLDFLIPGPAEMRTTGWFQAHGKIRLWASAARACVRIWKASLPETPSPCAGSRAKGGHIIKLDC
jgi:hypothetical protein